MTIRPRKTITSSRLYIVVIALTMFWLALEANLFRIQVVRHSFFREISEKQVYDPVILRASRGEILDRNGYKLATNTIHYDLAVDPAMVQNKRIIAQILSREFNKSVSHYLRKMDNDSRFVFLERSVPERRMERIHAIEDPGFIKDKRFRRSYPFKSDAGQLLGITDTENNGLSGLELDYDRSLKGVPGKAVLMYDGPRRISYSADFPLVKPKSGSNLYLTIDKNIQTITERALEKGVLKSKAHSGMAIVMDPSNGAVLAMVNYPKFDPNERKKRSREWTLRNRVVTDIIEPGSTFKIFNAAALLQENLKKLDDIVFCENGKYRIYHHTFHDSDEEGHAWLTLAKVLEKSSNIGMIKLCEDLHRNTMFRYLALFGMGMRTEIGLHGEAKGILKKPDEWSGLSKASKSIGHEVGVTAIQMASAYCAVVNGGNLYKPMLVRYEERANGKLKTLRKPEKVRRVISPEVSDLLKTVMINTVKRGTGKKAAIEGVIVGGKTGTAQKINPETKKYYRNKFLSSFIGFASDHDPQFVCAVFIDEPNVHLYHGGHVAAPVFREVIENIINLPNENMKPKRDNLQVVSADTTLPELTGMDVESACRLLEERNKKYNIAGVGGIVKSVEQKRNLMILNTAPMVVEMEKIPNLKGLSVREGLRLIDFSKVKVLVEGDGIIRRQYPRPGTELKSGLTLKLSCN